MVAHKTKTCSDYEWLRTGDQALRAMLQAIETARHSIFLETYIVSDSPIAKDFLAALAAACRRNVKVQVLVDALGSIMLSEDFWKPFVAAGGEFRWFNPLKFYRLGLRDHRKILVCDDQIAFIGGFNIAPEYLGDGVHSGWRDLGMKIQGALVRELRVAFEEMFERAPFEGKITLRPKRIGTYLPVEDCEAQLLLSGPARKVSPIKAALTGDLERARDIQIICAYFLPTWKIRALLMRAARRGARVQLILPSKSDVPLSQLAARSLYRRLLRSGVEIYEYQPQILHAKLMIFDDIVYVGSANLDTRSLHINYELLVRVRDSQLATEAREIFAGDLKHSLKVHLPAWHEARTWGARLVGRFAYFVLARLDPYLTGRQIRLLRWFKVIQPAKG